MTESYYRPCDKQHRPPQGPNEDLASCPNCYAPTYQLRPAGQTYGLHAEDCSLDERHEGYCQGGGAGHPPASLIRGYWPSGGERSPVLDR